MNTVSQSEGQALNAVAAAAAVSTGPTVDATVTVPEVATYELHMVPLSRLRTSARNVRKGGGTAIAELAASIGRVGLLQNLTVVASPEGVQFEVVAGRRRLAALKLLAKRRKLAKDHPVPCLLVPDASARTVSLTENVQREAMSPVDELFAWKALVADGRAVEDIAADFGVTPLVVKRRLRLANVSPRLLADYQQGEVSLEQLMALAITEDHAAQETAFYEAPQWQRSPESLRDHLTADEIDASRDALVRFVGLNAYEAEGGGIRRDLFADERSGVFLTDPGLLERLARDRLAMTAEQVQAEGWAWVDVVPRVTSAELHAFQRARRTRKEPTKADAKRIAKLEAEQQRIQDKLDDEDAELSDDGAEALYEQLDKLSDELEAIEQGLMVYAERAVALAGAVAAVDHQGGVVVHRGLLRPEDAKALQAQERAAERNSAGLDGAEGEGGTATTKRSGLSEKLVRRLSAHRTVALQAEVARHPRIALVALVHQLAYRVILGGYHGTPINITAMAQDRLEHHAPDIGESPAAKGLQEVRDAWAARLPGEVDALFTELLAMQQEDLMSLLALCVALTVSAVAHRESEAPAAALAQAVGLDMHGWWTPTAAGYFDHVSKAKSLEAVQVFAPVEVGRLAKLKKAEIASEAERLALGAGWIPSMLSSSEVALTLTGDHEVGPLTANS